MIRFITGVPGSGKSYYAVNHIYKAIHDPKYKNRYLYIYTNINQFKMDIDPRVCYYDDDQIFKRLQLLHKYYKAKATDKKLIRLARLLKLHKALFVIDEAHNYFDVNNPVRVWWLSYHRHLFQDIDLITQNLSLIHSKYKGFTEYFVRALPQSLRLFQKNFTYRLYIDSRMTQKGRAGTEKIKYNPEVFKLYHSGDKPKTKNVILHYLAIALAFLVLAGLVFYYVKESWSSDDENTDTKPIETKSHHALNISDRITRTRRNYTHYDTDISKVIYIACVNDICKFQDVVFPMAILKDLILSTDSKMLNVSPNYQLRYHRLYVLASGQFLQLFSKGVRNENDTNMGGLFTDRRRKQ